MVQLGAEWKPELFPFVEPEPFLLFWLLYVPHVHHVFSDQQLEEGKKLVDQ